MAIRGKFITFATKAEFEGIKNGIGNPNGSTPLTAALNGLWNNIPDHSVVFIKETGEVWHNGTYYGKPISTQIIASDNNTGGIVWKPSNSNNYQYRVFNLWGNTFDGSQKEIKGNLTIDGGLTYSKDRICYGDSQSSNIVNITDVMLENIGNQKVQVIKIVKDKLDLGLAAAKYLVDSAPCILVSNYPYDKALVLKEALEEVGATVTLTATAQVYWKFNYNGSLELLSLAIKNGSSTLPISSEEVIKWNSLYTWQQSFIDEFDSTDTLSEILSNYVTTNTTQTISGSKTFSSNILTTDSNINIGDANIGFNTLFVQKLSYLNKDILVYNQTSKTWTAKAATFINTSNPSNEVVLLGNGDTGHRTKIIDLT